MWGALYRLSALSVWGMCRFFMLVQKSSAAHTPYRQTASGLCFARRMRRPSSLALFFTTIVDDLRNQGVGGATHDGVAGLVDEHEFDFARFGFFVHAHVVQVFVGA